MQGDEVFRMNTCARIATVCQSQRHFRTVEENRAYIMGLLDDALRLDPDLVCLPETFTTGGVYGETIESLAETIPGPTTDAVAERARRANCYVICPILTRREDRVYNSAIVIGRSGEVVGIYDKRHPVTSVSDYSVLEGGVTPGTGEGIFDLDFGRIGIRICFDVGFPEDWERLARQGVRLVLWPSAYDGGVSLSTYAAFHQFYVVTSVSTHRSRVIDPFGTTLAATDPLCNIAFRSLNLDFLLCHYDFNYAVPDRIRADYGDRVEVRSHFEGGMFLVEPKDPTLTTAHLQNQYGLEDARQYFQRHRDAYAAYAQGEAPPVQRAPHGDRSMYSKR